MGIGVLFIYTLGFILLILSPISYLVLEKTGHKKAGVIVSLALALTVLVPAFLIIFESELYWKSDAINDLGEIETVLMDDFEILENEIVGSIEYYQTTKLLVSSKDRDRVIGSIETADNYKLMDSDKTLSDYMNRELSEKTIWNYKHNESFIRESYEKKDGFIPIQIIVTLQKASDTLDLRKIMD